MSITIAAILDTRRIKETNKYPIKLRVNHQRITRYFQTIFDLSREDYEKLSASRISAFLQNIKHELKRMEREAEDIAKEIEPFSFSEFEKRYIALNSLFHQRKRKSKPVIGQGDAFDITSYNKHFPILLEINCEPGTITWSYQKYIKRLLQEGRVSTAANYHTSYVSIKRFRGNVMFKDISPSYLIAYEQQLKAEGKSKSTIGFYVRPLRAVYNEAVEDGLARKDKSYPFGRRKYQIPSACKVKKALELTDVEQIYYYPDDKLSESEQKCRAYWLFSYFGNGMNPKDIACLKYGNTHDDYLIFERAKTERSLRESPITITIFLNEDMKAIIERWGNKPALPNTYIFPILYQGITPMRQYLLISNFVHLINNNMRQILAYLKIKKKVTTYVARHTFSTVLKKSGASTEQIQEALGHTDIKTTERYLDSFDRETKKHLSSRLTSFKEATKGNN